MGKWWRLFQGFDENFEGDGTVDGAVLRVCGEGCECRLYKLNVCAEYGEIEIGRADVRRAKLLYF